MRATLFRDDCLELMKTFQDNSIDFILTDPPSIGIEKNEEYFEIAKKRLESEIQMEFNNL